MQAPFLIDSAMATAIAPLTVLAYLASGLALALGFLKARPMLRLSGVVLALLAAIGHALLVWHVVNTPAGWDVNFINTLAVAAWMIVVVLLLSALRWRVLETGIVAFPGAAITVALLWLVDTDPLILNDLSPQLELHVFSSLLAYSLLSIAAIKAVVLAVQDYLLRHPRTIRQLEMLPPLSMLEAVMFSLIMAGWVVLTVSLLTGLMFVDNLLAQHLVHKTVLSIVSWLLFGGLLFGRWWYGWRGRRAIHWTLGAMFVLALAYFGSKLVLEVMLDRSWSDEAPTTVAAISSND